MKYSKRITVDAERNRAEDMAKLADAFFENLMRDNCEYGGIGLDDKRPFGNSAVASDILEIIGWDGEADGGADGEYADGLYDDLLTYLPAEWKRMKAELASFKAVAACDKPTPDGGAK